MKFTIGVWIGLVGYALVWTGVNFFTGNPTVSLADALGFTPIQPPDKAAALPASGTAIGPSVNRSSKLAAA